MGVRMWAATGAVAAAAATASLVWPVADGRDSGAGTVELVARPPAPGARPALFNSKDGRPVLAIAAMAPREQRTGTVTLRNAGGAPMHVTLLQRDLVAASDSAGRSLRDVLHLRVNDVTTGAAVYSGPLDLLPRTRVCGVRVSGQETCPAWRGGETHDLEFVVTMRDAGNEYAGRRLSVTYDWVASEPRSGA